MRFWPKRRKADVILPNHRDLRSHLYRIEGERFILEGWFRDSDGCMRLDLVEESAFRRRHEWRDGNA